MTRSQGPRRGLRTGAVAAAAAAAIALTAQAFVATAAERPSTGSATTSEPGSVQHPNSGSTGAAPDPTKPGPHTVATATYNLGDTAFRNGGYHVELAGVVHYPADVATGNHPLVIMAHGLFATCDDAAAATAWTAAFEATRGRDQTTDPAERARQEKVIEDTERDLHRWPCAPGTPAYPNDRGYDYLGRNLASHGIVVVSIGANGINAGPAESNSLDDFTVRAALVNKHLELWQQLSTSGTGPLAGRLAAGFTGHVDLTNVGTLGHSRGGRAAVFQASGPHRAEWPAGVQVKAVVPLEPVISGGGDDHLLDGVPFALVVGACDSVSNDLALSYFSDAKGRNRAPIHQFMVSGANHNFFNTQWSPDSGKVLGYDDAFRYAPEPFAPPGQCRTTDADQALQDQLSEADQRLLGTGYIAAFYRRYLAGETVFDPMLTGQEHPLSTVGTVDVEFAAPVS